MNVINSVQLPTTIIERLGSGNVTKSEVSLAAIDQTLSFLASYRILGVLGRDQSSSGAHGEGVYGN